MEIVWRTNGLASGLYAAERIVRGERIVLGDLAAALAEPAEQLRRVLGEAGPAERLWRHLLPLAGTGLPPRELADTTLRKGQGRNPEGQVARLAAAISDLAAALREAFPRLDEELRLRIGPLRELWEARGPGLLKGVARRTDERILVPRAEVLLVQPALGGGGIAHLAYNSVFMEALLANVHPMLPETVRLGWWLSQLALELPLFADAIPGDRLYRVAALGMVPATLEAAADVEWIVPSPALLRETLVLWRLVPPDDLETPALLDNWWQTQVTAPAAWSIALTALDKLLPGSQE